MFNYLLYLLKTNRARSVEALTTIYQTHKTHVVSR